MTESRLTYDQFKADILRWKNSHREEYNRFARLMTNGDERQYLAICRAIFKQLPKVKIEWELCWGDDSVEDFDNINLLFSEESIPKQIVGVGRNRAKQLHHKKQIPNLWQIVSASTCVAPSAG